VCLSARAWLPALTAEFRETVIAPDCLGPNQINVSLANCRYKTCLVITLRRAYHHNQEHRNQGYAPPPPTHPHTHTHTHTLAQNHSGPLPTANCISNTRNITHVCDIEAEVRHAQETRAWIKRQCRNDWPHCKPLLLVFTAAVTEFNSSTATLHSHPYPPPPHHQHHHPPLSRGRCELTCFRPSN